MIRYIVATIALLMFSELAIGQWIGGNCFRSGNVFSVARPAYSLYSPYRAVFRAPQRPSGSLRTVYLSNNQAVSYGSSGSSRVAQSYIAAYSSSGSAGLAQSVPQQLWVWKCVTATSASSSGSRWSKSVLSWEWTTIQVKIAKPQIRFVLRSYGNTNRRIRTLSRLKSKQECRKSLRSKSYSS